MIDWHSHILPKLDDGSQSNEESGQLLKMLAQQGVDTVIATPHFHANHESVESFLTRRKAAHDALETVLFDGAPKILLGAEVRYYPGISRMEGLSNLKIEGANLLLLEMPMAKWTEYTVNELVQLASLSKTTVVLAHIERYLALQSAKVMRKLYSAGILMQVNASFFTGVFTKRKALDMLISGGIHFIGSDCHNVKSRPPKIGNAFGVIKKKFGKDFVCQINGYGKAALDKNI